MTPRDIRVITLSSSTWAKVGDVFKQEGGIIMNTNISRTSIVLLTGLLLFLLIAAGLGAAATRTVSAQTILYVDDDSCPQVGSGTQLDPYCRIQTAVNAADDGDEIRVAAGYYSDSETVSFLLYGDPYTHTQVVLITKTLTLRGGYSADTWDTSSVTKMNQMFGRVNLLQPAKPKDYSAKKKLENLIFISPVLIYAMQKIW